MSELFYPRAWLELESPSMRYELILTAEELSCGHLECSLLEEKAAFILDEISFRERPIGIVGGCIFENEKEAFLIFLNEYEQSLNSCREAATENRKPDLSNLALSASALIDIMTTRGVP